MNRPYTEIIKELDDKIPRDAVKERDAGRGMKLSYLEGHYVIDRLNKVVGIGNWAYGSKVTKVYEGTLKDKYDKDRFATSYIAEVRLVVQLGEEKINTEFVDVGYGDGFDSANPGKAHELAVKEAITDGLKRCAKNLGMSMGLALYDKTQENVDDGLERTTTGNTTSTVKAATPKASPVVSSGSSNSANRGSGATAKEPGPGRDDILRKISAISQAKIKLKRTTYEGLVELLKSFGVESKEELSEVQAKTLLTQLEAL